MTLEEGAVRLEDENRCPVKLKGWLKIDFCSIGQILIGEAGVNSVVEWNNRCGREFMEEKQLFEIIGLT